MNFVSCKTSQLFYMVLLVLLFVSGCGGAETQTTEPAVIDPTAVPTEAPIADPTDVPPTVAPTEAPTEVPTEAPTAAPTNTSVPSEEVYFEWAPGGVRPSDSDDVDGIVLDIIEEEGILNGFGNEIGITVVYNPALITVEELMELFDGIGHPVALPEE